MSNSKFSPIVAVTALVVAVLGSTPLGHAAARVVLPSNSVGSTQLKSNAVTGTKVKNGSLLAADFKTGQLPVGAAGAQGAPGAAGPRRQGRHRAARPGRRRRRAGPEGRQGRHRRRGCLGCDRCHGCDRPAGSSRSSRGRERRDTRLEPPDRREQRRLVARLLRSGGARDRRRRVLPGCHSRRRDHDQPGVNSQLQAIDGSAPVGWLTYAHNASASARQLYVNAVCVPA